jgi:RNA polymerase sigma factor for flagellar operon FliA
LDKEQELLVKRIALKIFKQYCPRGESGFFTREDLFHHGIIGLLKAKEKFNKNMNVPFNAYASIRIQGEIMDTLRKSPHIRLPQERRKQLKIFLRAKNDLLDQGKPANIEDIAQKLGWDEKTVLTVENLLNQVISIDAQPGFRELADGNPGTNAEKNVLDQDLADIMQQCLEALDDAKERLVLVARELKNMKLRQVAQKLGWSIEKVRQKQISAKESMKTCLEKNGWDLT